MSGDSKGDEKIAESSEKQVPLDELVSSPLRELPDVPRQPPPPPKKPQKREDALEKSLASAAKKAADLANRATEQRLEHDRADHKQILVLRSVMGFFGLAVVVWWQIRILSIVEDQGKAVLNIQESVLLAIVTTTTVNVFGFLVIVMKFVFPAKIREQAVKKDKPPDDEE